MSAITMIESPIGPVIRPTAGVGGSLYDTTFPVAIYPGAPNNIATWRMLDTWNNLQVNTGTTTGIAAGLVWATLTYLLALTPKRKRSTAFHTFMLMGLVFLLLHLMIKLVASLTPGLQALSAYTFVTFDLDNSIWTTKFVATFVAGEVTGWFAFSFAAICLWLQAKSLMTGLKVSYPGPYKVILTYLVGASLAALGAAMANSIHQTMELTDSTNQPEQAVTEAYQMRVSYLITVAVSLGSFSLVSMVSVVHIVWKRPASVINGNSAYASALNLMGLLCAQSFVIPFIFCILQILPSQTGITNPETMLLPAIYMILPLGSLFMTVNSDLRVNVAEVESPRTPTFQENSAPPNTNFINSERTLTDSPATRPSCCATHSAYAERELSRIDAMDVGTNDTENQRRAAETNKDSEEKEVVISVNNAA